MSKPDTFSVMVKTDEDIIRRVLEGDRKAFAQLIERHKDRGMTLAVRMLKNTEDAEEALQDAFLRVFRSLPSFEWKSSFATYFYRIVYNVCATRLQRRDRQFITSLQEDAENEQPIEPAAPDGIPDIEYESVEFRTILQEEIERLDAASAAVLTMFLMNELSYDEITEITGMPLGTVKTRLFRARTALREAITARYAERIPAASHSLFSLRRVRTA